MRRGRCRDGLHEAPPLPALALVRRSSAGLGTSLPRVGSRSAPPRSHRGSWRRRGRTSWPPAGRLRSTCRSPSTWRMTCGSDQRGGNQGSRCSGRIRRRRIGDRPRQRGCASASVSGVSRLRRRSACSTISFPGRGRGCRRRTRSTRGARTPEPRRHSVVGDRAVVPGSLRAGPARRDPSLSSHHLARGDTRREHGSQDLQIPRKMPPPGLEPGLRD